MAGSTLPAILREARPWSRRRSVRLRRVRGWPRSRPPQPAGRHRPGRQGDVCRGRVRGRRGARGLRGGARPGPRRRRRGHAARARDPDSGGAPGARSALTGASVAIEGGIVLNVEGLNTVSEVDALEGIAVAGPGVINADLKAPRRRSRGSSTRPTPPPPPSARSAATSPPTPAGCAASSTASPPTTSAGCRSCCPAARSSAPAGAPPRESPGST